jgi:hypothetical protein
MWPLGPASLPLPQPDVPLLLASPLMRCVSLSDAPDRVMSEHDDPDVQREGVAGFPDDAPDARGKE